jgi:hypothetical protein
MQANFIESSPLPVKAVLAMMGKIEEVYRLPLLPMRRDTRSRLQKIVAEVGLIAKPTGPAPRHRNFSSTRTGPPARKDRAAPRIVRPMQPRQRPSRRPRHQSRPLARPLRDAARSPRKRPRHDRRFDSQRVQVRVRKLIELLIVDC